MLIAFAPEGISSCVCGRQGGGGGWLVGGRGGVGGWGGGGGGGGVAKAFSGGDVDNLH